ncbi:hypothetical protein BSKO_06849 [Bryopsis sp. KO-2023]|nr:hypothetical protein BSKO_06849 [Bryopsis sp. KO-2023]
MAESSTPTLAVQDSGSGFHPSEAANEIRAICRQAFFNCPEAQSAICESVDVFTLGGAGCVRIAAIFCMYTSLIAGFETLVENVYTVCGEETLRWYVVRRTHSTSLQLSVTMSKCDRTWPGPSGSEIRFSVRLHDGLDVRRVVECVHDVLSGIDCASPPCSLVLRLRGSPLCRAWQEDDEFETLDEQEKLEVRYRDYASDNSSNHLDRLRIALLRDHENEEETAQHNEEDCAGKREKRVAIGCATYGRAFKEGSVEAVCGLVQRGGSTLAENSAEPEAEVLLFDQWGVMDAGTAKATLWAATKASWGLFGLRIRDHGVSEALGQAIIRFHSPRDGVVAPRLIAIHVGFDKNKVHYRHIPSPALGPVVKQSIEKALEDLKQQAPDSLIGKAEEKLKHGMAFLGESIANVVRRSDNMNFQQQACSLVGCQTPADITENVMELLREASKWVSFSPILAPACMHEVPICTKRRNSCVCLF